MDNIEHFVNGPCGFAIDGPSMHHSTENEAACMRSPGSKSSTTTKTDLLPRALSLRPSSHRIASACCSRTTTNGSMSQNLVNRPLLDPNNQMQDWSRIQGQETPNHATSLRAPPRSGRKWRCPYYADPAIRCQCRERHISQLLRHMRKHQFYFCGKDCQVFIGRNARADWERHNRGNHGDQKCIYVWCRCRPPPPNGHPKTPGCTLWHDLNAERKWQSIFALIFPDTPLPPLEESRVPEESFLHSPIPSASPSSTSGVSDMVVEPQLPNVTSPSTGVNVLMDQQVPWLALTPTADPNGTDPVGTPHGPSGLSNPPQPTGISSTTFTEHNQVVQHYRQLVQQNALFQRDFNLIAETHLQLCRIDPTTLSRSELLDLILGWQHRMLHLPLEYIAQMNMNSSNTDPDNNESQMAIDDSNTTTRVVDAELSRARPENQSGQIPDNSDFHFWSRQ